MPSLERLTGGGGGPSGGCGSVSTRNAGGVRRTRLGWCLPKVLVRAMLGECWGSVDGCGVGRVLGNESRTENGPWAQGRREVFDWSKITGGE